MWQDRDRSLKRRDLPTKAPCREGRGYKRIRSGRSRARSSNGLINSHAGLTRGLRGVKQPAPRDSHLRDRQIRARHSP